MTDRPKERTAMRGAIKTWKEAHANYLQMQTTAMQLFSHPDATDEQKLAVANKLGDTRNFLVDSRQKITKHRAYHDVWLAATDINGVKL